LVPVTVILADFHPGVLPRCVLSIVAEIFFLLFFIPSVACFEFHFNGNGLQDL